MIRILAFFMMLNFDADNHDVGDDPSRACSFDNTSELFGPFRSVFQQGDGGDQEVFPDDWSPFASPLSGDDGRADPASTGAALVEPRHGPLASSSLDNADRPVSSDCQVDAPSDQPVIPSTVHESIIARNLFSNFDATGITLPWESGIFKELLSDEDFPTSLVPKMPISSLVSFGIDDEPQAVTDAVASVVTHSKDLPVFSSCISSGDDLHFHDQRRQLRDAAVGKILIVLRHCLLASQTGRHIIGLGTDLQQQEGAFDIVSSVLGVRSPATLVKRANSLLSFLRWVAKRSGDVVNPFTEQLVWEYFQFLKDSNAPATRAESALSALRFAHDVLGFECLEEAIRSRRLVGIAEIMMTGKRLLRQALTLSVAQIKCLHGVLEDSQQHVVDRALAAYLLFALYGRCRNSDLAAIRTLDTDFDDEGGFVVITTSCHKSGRLASLKTRLMPIVIPARGVDGKVWPKVAMDAMRDAGCLQENPIDGPLMCAPMNGHGDFMNRGLRSSEVSRILRRFLGLGEPAAGCQSEIVSSHSLKATMLSWCARYGLTPQTRSLLGRHTSCLNETFAIYSRDLVCAPVAELQMVIDAVHSGDFCPDSDRSRFFKPPASGERVEEQPEVKVEEGCIGEPNDVGYEGSGNCFAPLDGASDESDSSSSGSGAMSSDDSEVADPPTRVKRFRARIPTDEQWYVHSKSHLVHRFDGSSHNTTRFLVCGKRLTEAYALCTEATAWNVLCKSCNRK